MRGGAKGDALGFERTVQLESIVHPLNERRFD
jgi:hypothetical protein